jgi:hypothetical protein
MVKQRILYPFWALLALLTWSTQLCAANISVQTDRASILATESFRLTFSADAEVDADPDFSPLQQDFEIANSSQTSNISIINGRMQRQHAWILTVFPKRAGTLTVPAIRFGADISPELQIEVQTGNAAAAVERDVFLKVEIAPKDPYAQAQAVVTVLLYRAVNMNNESLSPLEFDSNDVLVHELGEAKNYEASLSGRLYAVHERKYAVFPQNPGTLTLQPVRYSGNRMDNSRGFFDPFGTFNRGPALRLQSSTVALQVRPLPAGQTALTWLPATDLQLKEEWSADPATFKVGEPITRKLKIIATGLTAEQLPELPKPQLQSFKQYPDQPALENRTAGDAIQGIRQESTALMPTRPGQHELPAIEIKWWNTRTERIETAQLPARTVTVAAGAEQPASAPALQEDNSYIENDVSVPPESTTTSGNIPAAGWLAIIFGLGWLLTGYGWWRHARSRQQPPAPTAQPLPDPATAEKSLHSACTAGDPQQAKNALLIWARSRWPAETVNNLDALAEQVADAEFAAHLYALSAHLYAARPAGNSWDGMGLWQAFKKFKTIRGEQPAASETLAPLHRI